MKRGDIVIVAASGDCSKPRPAVVVQSDGMPANHPSVVVCQMTSLLSAASDFRITLEPTIANGLRLRCQIMVDKPTTVKAERISRSIGRLTTDELSRLDRSLGAVLGFAD
ncbi:MAG: type II toxin-antitoxin system PemK/MazF family toxin [Bosea sp. (in: a-proteobacteria)]|uniref:type II toxin-antitoxin system PemK/MazF family toxin n=1 Tax=Bosea sp. (in: a-proteobacteria) TaxID=1871050 RepID=UPI0027374F3C|nr:type II toxin-antitoxin system PemK/MazF family toxin [Bosea sp. (in: a-proteobacteria)]MDP3254853.1 type II toxin-antitoxin system PemK/MazF family toxin [Bosea sp. (in: a-proteobacteria)]MDP3320617.1 type II toxin-antitoxin system PemK/MazF family toxin [Bosea sp. (in: a-proteobacteria)]